MYWLFLGPGHVPQCLYRRATADVATCTEEDFVPRMPCGLDQVTVANLVLHSPAASADLLAHLLTANPSLQVDREAIRFGVGTAVEVEQQLLIELTVGVNGSLASGGVPAAYISWPPTPPARETREFPLCSYLRKRRVDDSLALFSLNLTIQAHGRCLPVEGEGVR